MSKANKGKKSSTSSATIALNKKANHDFYIEDRFEAGIALQGWEVKSLREGRVQLRDSHVIIKNGEAFLLGALITPLQTASAHSKPEDDRTRKLLLHKKEVMKLMGAIDRQGYTVVPTAMYWKQGKVKVEVALAKGKKLHDKRAVTKEREWNREKARALKTAK